MSFLSPVRAGDGVPIDGYAAVVDDHVITIGDVLAFVQPVEEQLRLRFDGPELQSHLEQAFETGLQTLIDRALIIADFKDQKGQIPDKMVDERIQQIIQERFNNDRAAAMKALEKEHMTQEDWRKQIREQLIVLLMRRREVLNKIVLSPATVRHAYEKALDTYRIPARVHLYMIVLHRGATDEENQVKLEEAQKVLARIRAGEDFSLIARSVSEGNKAVKGGDWGWIEPKALRQELADAVQKLKTGEVSDVITAGDNYYILKVAGRQDESVTPFSEVKDKIEKAERQAEEERLYKAWIKRLKQKHYVKIFDTP